MSKRRPFDKNSLCFLLAASGALLACNKDKAQTPEINSLSQEAKKPPAALPEDLCAGAKFSIPAGKALASVDGKKITEKDLKNEAGSELDAARQAYCQQVWEIQNEAVDALVDEQLLENAAKQAGKKKEDFLDDYIRAKVTPPTDEELIAFYEERAREDAPPLEEVKEDVIAALTEEQEGTAMSTLMEELRAQAKVKLSLPDMRPPPKKLSIPKTAPSSGPSDAPITLIEFSDFECPYCAQGSEMVAELKELYPKDLRVVFWHFPLSFHENAQPAALYSQCANEQGLFWQYHDLVFSNQEQMGPSDLMAYAVQAGLDEAKLAACLDNGEAESTVEKAIEAAEAYGVDATPTFVLDGRRVGGADIKAAIDAALKEKAKK